MNILISNDDGYFARGIKVLAEQARELGQVTVVAPDRNRSGASNSITLGTAVEVWSPEPDVYAIGGTPADCYQIASAGLLKSVPDMVLSGINDGPNMGDDTFYSGTVAAAREGRFLKYPPIATSMASFSPQHYETAAKVVMELVQQFQNRDKQDVLSLFATGPQRTVLNVNVPDLPYSELKGVKVTRTGTRHKAPPAELQNEADQRAESDVKNGVSLYRLGPAGDIDDDSEGTDFHAVANGFVSVTPLKTDQTDHRQLENLDRLLS